MLIFEKVGKEKSSDEEDTTAATPVVSEMPECRPAGLPALTDGKTEQVKDDETPLHPAIEEIKADPADVAFECFWCRLHFTTWKMHKHVR